MTRCAKAMGAGQRSFGAGSCAQRVMPEPITASHLLMELLANPLSQQAGKWLVIPQTADYAITSDLASVNQRLISPYFGDLAEWLCKAVGSPSRMASSFISNVSEVRL